MCLQYVREFKLVRENYLIFSLINIELIMKSI